MDESVHAVTSRPIQKVLGAEHIDGVTQFLADPVINDGSQVDDRAGAQLTDDLRHALGVCDIDVQCRTPSTSHHINANDRLAERLKPLDHQLSDEPRGAGHHGVDGHSVDCFRMWNSTRRLSSRPSSVLLSAMGLDSP